MRDDWCIEQCAYEIASHENLEQEVIYLMAQANDLDTQERWELVRKWNNYRNK